MIAIVIPVYQLLQEAFEDREFTTSTGSVKLWPALLDSFPCLFYSLVHWLGAAGPNPSRSAKKEMF